jgi:lantibiotic biosynthesis protein
LTTPVTASCRRLLTGTLADRARDAVFDIARDLENDRKPLTCDLAYGAAGQALFFASAAEAFGDARYATLAEQRLDAAVRGLEEQVFDASLFGGVCGVAWTVDLLADNGDVIQADSVDDDPNAEVDAVLNRALRKDPWTGRYDLISGLVGIGVYAMQRVRRESGRQLLSNVVQRLDGLAEPRGQGCCWRTPPEHLPLWQRKAAPRGYVNLGLAHGVPGVIALLAKAVLRDVEAPSARALLDRSVTWLLTQRGLDREVGFAAWSIGAEQRSSTQSAWCYGDPGVTAALFMAAGAAKRDDWERDARELARAIAKRDPEGSGIRDAGLCHGAAGIAHILHRLYRAEGDPFLRAAAVSWFERTLAMRTPGVGVGGFVHDGMGRTGDEHLYSSNSGFLVGSAGIGLALMAALSDTAPTWDQVLLVDI